MTWEQIMTITQKGYANFKEQYPFEDPVIIRNFNDLYANSALESRDCIIQLYSLEGENDYDAGSVQSKSPLQDFSFYMSTHTFYSKGSVELTTMVLQLCGFNVELKSIECS